MFLGIIALIKFFMTEQIPPLPKPAQNKEKEVAYDYNYEQLAKMQEIFLEQARKNPDIKLIDLDEAVKGIGGEGEKKILEKATLDYKDARHKMLELWEQSGFEKIGHDARGDIMNGEKLYEIVTGIKPEAKIAVQLLPFAIFMKCEKFDDFGILYGALHLNKDASLEARLNKIKEIQKKVSGLATHFQFSFFDTKVPLIIMNSEIYESMLEEKIEKTKNYTIAHEEQHIINDFFTEVLFYDKTSASQEVRMMINKKKQKEEANEEFGLEDVREDLTVLAEKLKKQASRKAQNEIMAYLKGGRAPKEISQLLKEKDGMYDYFGKKRNLLADKFRKLFGDNGEIFLTYVQAEFYNGYGKAIDTATALCEILLTKYSAEEIVPYLNVAPIWKWEEVKQKLMGDRL